MEVQTLLVDSCHGIYAWKSLAERYPLFRENGEPISDTLKAELIDVDAEDYLDVIEYECDEIYVQHESGLFYHVQQLDGDIWAIHPDAQWSETFESYYVVGPNDLKFTVPAIVPYFLEYGYISEDWVPGTGEKALPFQELSDEEREARTDYQRLSSFFDMRTTWAKAFTAGFYDIIEESEFSWSNDVVGWKVDNTIDVVVRVDMWKACNKGLK